MPKKVDHGQRRQEIVDAYVGLVADVGLEAATTRALTGLLGVSTGSLWNYFGSHAELVTEAFRQTLEVQRRRIARIAEAESGLEGLVSLIREILPLSPDTRREAGISIEFWHKGIQFHDEFNAVQGDSEGYWISIATRFLLEAADAGDLRDNLDPRGLADVLVVLMGGLQIEYMMETGLGSLAELQRIARLAVSPWLSGQGLGRLEEITAARPLTTG